jgi:Sec-independent protein secretion pathway component TatC
MNTSSNPDQFLFIKPLLIGLINSMEEGTKLFARTAWMLSLSILTEHWLLIVGIFFSIFVILIFLAVLGNWGGLYSLTYWTLYVVIVFIAGLIWGPEILFSDIYHIVYIILLNPVCYYAVSRIWDRFGFRRKTR